MVDSNEWVSLGEAADILGVHPSTVRHWADSGDLPSQRTPGGHRRFRRRDLQQWASMQQQEVAPAEAQLMLQNALGRARMETSDGQLHGQPWYDNLDEEARKVHRRLGRQLLELLTKYLADPDEQETLLVQVRSLGTEYGQISRNQGIRLSESVRAFLFFRDLLTESVIQLAEMLSLRTPLDWGDRLQQVNLITDELLIALIQEYETEI